MVILLLLALAHAVIGPAVAIGFFIFVLSVSFL
jgi:hypothetical protein